MTVACEREGGWVVARGKKTRKAKVRCSLGIAGDQKPTTHEEQLHLRGKVKDAKNLVSDSRFYEHVLKVTVDIGAAQALGVEQSLPTPERVVIWGLGSQRQPKAAHIQCQLAFICLLLKRFSPTPVIEAVDPAFTPADTALLKSLGMQVFEENRLVASGPTLYFLAHCGASLTERLLAANDTAGTLHNVILMGNSLSRVADAAKHCRRQHSEGGVPTVAAVVNDQHPRWVLEETHLPEFGFPVVSAFNDFSLHAFHLTIDRT